MDLLGKTVGQYELTELISESEKNLVYKATQAAMNRAVAVKILSPSQAWDQAVVQQFQQEVQLIAGLQHQNILPVYDYGQDQGVMYMASRLIVGATLKERLPQFYSVPHAQQIITAVAEALDYAHGQGVVHGNLKPANVLLDEKRQPLLTDFGLFQNMGDLGQGNAYQSPEQARNSVVDHQTDIYALGVLLHHMLIGQPPQIGVAPNPRQNRPDLPVEVEQVILTAMAQYPEQRYQSAGEMSQALAMATGSATQPTPVVAAAPSPAKPTAEDVVGQETQQTNNRTMWLIGAGAVIVIALLACIFFFVIFPDKESGEVVVPTPAPAVPSITAEADTDIRSGPGPVYDRIGGVKKGQSAEAIGRSPDSGWWVLKVPAAASGQGWVSASTVTAVNTDNLPIIDPPPLPVASPTFTPTPEEDEPEPPRAIIDGSTKAQAGQQVLFSARNSFAADGSRLVGYQWDFADGTESSGVDVTHVYDDDGTYEVKLTVTDDQDLSNTTSHKIRVDKVPDTPEPDEPPVAVINGPTQGKVGESVSFDGNQSTCATSCVSYVWEMGDGAVYDAAAVDYVYTVPAEYIVTLTVSDETGLRGSTTITIDVEGGEEPVPPIEPTEEP